MISRSRLIRAASGAVLSGAVVVGWAAIASAHAILIGASPANGAVVGTAPASVRLTFDEPIDLGRAAFDFRDGRGIHQPTSISHAAGKARIVVLGVPTLPNGEVAVDWRAVSDDGHTASGDVLFVVGAAASRLPLAASPRAPSSGVLAPLADFGRLMWYAAICLMAGALAFGVCLDRWRARAGIDVDGYAIATRVWLDALRYGWVLLLNATLFRLIVTSMQLDSSGNGVPFVHGLTTLLSHDAAPGWLLMLTSTLLLRPCIVRLRLTAGRLSRILTVDRRILGGCILAAAFGEALVGHALDHRLPAVGVVSIALHVVAFSSWLGTLLILLALAGSRAWRRVADAERRALMVGVIRTFAPIGLAAVLLLAVSGVVNAQLISAGGIIAWGTRYQDVLVLKVGLLALAVPLGWWHWRAGRHRLIPRSLPRTLVAEAVALGSAATLAAVLVGLSPAPAASSAATSGVFACAAQQVQDVNCYESALVLTLGRKGPQAALDSLRTLNDNIPYVRSQCHQVAHDIGRAAFTLYGSAKTALLDADPLCDAGYIHGVLEQAVSQLPVDQLRSSMTSWCTPTPDHPHSFSYFNCLHGIGHGLAIRFNGDVPTSLGYCDAFTDAWTMNECDSGVFMQVIVATWNEPVTSLPAQGDLVWPCDTVRADQQRPCYLMATDRVLRFDGFDISKTFEVCDQVETMWRSTCYQSLGRDISGMDLLDPTKVIADCGKAGALGPDDCLDGAVRNAVYDQGDGLKAGLLCAAAPATYRARCIAVRADALSRL